jgi:hypothetical protein
MLFQMQSHNLHGGTRMSQEGSNYVELGTSQMQVRSVTAGAKFQLSLHLVHK